jgi:hypothetical protein
MLAPWVIEEVNAADFGDKRLNARFSIVLSQLGQQPTASIPTACGGYAEMMAAYRFFENDKVDFDTVLAPHIESTRERIAAQPVALMVADTTETDVTRPHQQVRGAGPLDAGSRRGAELHLMHVFTPDGTPLGTVQAFTWVRDDHAVSLTRAQRATIPIEDKESVRWVNSMRQAREEAKRCPGTQIVCVADSEADIYELIAEAMAEPRTVDWIVRSCQDRALVDPAREETMAPQHLRAALLAAPVLFTQTIDVRGRAAKTSCEDRRRRQPRRSRSAEVEVRAARVTLRAPWRPDRILPDLSVNAILAREINPPADDVPVEWILLTNLHIDTVEQVRENIQYYCGRWMIELFFRTLKSGCRVEKRRFEQIDRVLSCLAVYLIVAWRTLYVCRLGRSLPEISCEAVFEPAEWKSVYQVLHHQSPPKQPPSLHEMVRMVAQLGGYMNQKWSDEPGPQAVWIGLQRMSDMARCWDLFGPGARENSERGPTTGAESFGPAKDQQSPH